MKKFIAGIIIMLCLQSNCVWSQIAPANYSATYDLSNSLIAYVLTLQSDNSFTFHFYRKNKCENCVEEHKYGKGAWNSIGNSLELKTNAETDIDEKHLLNLQNSKARLIKKRNAEGKKIELLKFYESDIVWVKGMELRVVQ